MEHALANTYLPPEVFICENPTIVGLAAARLGHSCPPLVCVDGEIKTAGRVLLRALQDGGSKLFYHGDFDWPGIAIANRIFREFSALPWRFDDEAYAETADLRCKPLTGIVLPTPWSPRLSQMMELSGRACDEELVSDALLADLELRHRHSASGHR
jgi:uncharacterized protein (TIGR02679 family)